MADLRIQYRFAFLQSVSLGANFVVYKNKAFAIGPTYIIFDILRDPYGLATCSYWKARNKPKRDFILFFVDFFKSLVGTV